LGERCHRIALISGEKPLQLTLGTNDGDPAWSPDGRQIAFAHFSDSGDQKKLYVIPALGGSERHVDPSHLIRRADKRTNEL
jgi:Tol biopolymer transport system component